MRSEAKAVTAVFQIRNPQKLSKAIMGTLALIGLGSNVGDRKAHLDAAIAALAQTPRIAVGGVSSYHETAPVGGPAGQHPYLNAAATLETTLSPQDLLASLRRVESGEGRVRTVRWSERTLDLDLLLFGDHIIDEPDLEVPHPRFAVRRFVLAPACELAAAVVDPLTGRSLADLLARLDRRPSYVAIAFPFNDNRRDATIESVVARLQAEAVRAGADLSGVAKRREGRSARDTWLDHVGKALRTDRWSAGTTADRWIVSDVWFDQILGDIPDRANLTPEDEVFLERFYATRGDAIEPTFVARPPLAMGGGRHGLRSLTTRGIPSDVPIIPLSSTSPAEMTDEILAACAATRAS